MTNQQKYEPGKCWYGIKTQPHGNVQPCGVNGNLYAVRRDHEYRNTTPSAIVRVWLCDNHVKVMQGDGYVVVRVPANNKGVDVSLAGD